MKKLESSVAYRSLAAAVLVSALDDSPTRFKVSKKTGKYEECNYQNRATALIFFKTGQFRFWADAADFSCDLLMKTHEERKEQKLYQDIETKEWLSETDLAQVIA